MIIEHFLIRTDKPMDFVVIDTRTNHVIMKTSSRNIALRTVQNLLNS